MWVLAIPALAFVGLLLLVSATRPALRSVYREGRLPGAQVVVA
jgi:hypothetical protein